METKRPLYSAGDHSDLPVVQQEDGTFLGTGYVRTKAGVLKLVHARGTSEDVCRKNLLARLERVVRAGM